MRTLVQQYGFIQTILKSEVLWVCAILKWFVFCLILIN